MSTTEYMWRLVFAVVAILIIFVIYLLLTGPV
jgi:hypothetical protein